MTSFDDLLSQVPIGQIAAKLGVDEATASDAVHKALPALLGGLQARTGNQQQNQAVQGLIDQHQEGGLLDGGVDIDQVDTKAGAEIVDDVFGEEKNTVINALGETGSGGNDLVAKVMPILAPIVLAYLGKQMLGGKSGEAAEAGDRSAASGGPLGDLLGGLLGGASKSGGIGGALSEALGKDAGSTLGKVLGGLFGKR
ncbi:DUF937 domain-containing protein [Nocardia terpenica]|uniref:DUF937 domain-containing protein n=1 Tax=Nocardia terpenica TaxID=455432 RepID=A0A164HY75_9NOCA|nr:DUF937 domain-containing protein [Nocardia terpenica]KZM68924.1 hypothetical protein AWN90_14225 [Nocardia terpenica]NQE88012.1 DUF937 domain-containing protein [Nocardia terpenica]